MHRQSSASFGGAPRMRASMAGGHSNVTSQRIAAKQSELQALQDLRAESARLAQEMAKLGDNVDTLAEGGESAWLFVCCCVDMKQLHL